MNKERAKGLNPFEFRASFGPMTVRELVKWVKGLNPFELRASFGLEREL